MFCEKCGNNIADDSKFCPFCGAVKAGDSHAQTEGAQAGPQPARAPQHQLPPQQAQQHQPQPHQQTQPLPMQPLPMQPQQYQQPPPQQPASQLPPHQPPPPQQPPAAKKSPVVLISIIIAVVLVLGGAGTAYLLLQRNSDSPFNLFGANQPASNKASRNDTNGDDSDATQSIIKFTTTSPSDETQTTETTGGSNNSGDDKSSDEKSSDEKNSDEKSTEAILQTTEETTTGAEASSTSEATTQSAANGGDSALPFVSYSYENKKPEAVIEFSTIDSVFPSNYRTLDSLAVFTGYCDYGELEVLIDVEVPGFTQPYRQKVKIGRQVTKLRIVPPLITGTIDLNSEKMAQLVYSVTEVESGKLLVQESKNIKLYSKFDIIWGDQNNWDAFTDNLLAWMTPDAPEITALKRDAIDYLALITNGALEGIYGYQDYHYFEHYYSNTWAQALAIQGAMSDIVQVRYNNSWFSMDAQQRVKLPVDTLSTRSGLCVETSLVMASALESSGMHVMLIFPPGHTQVAVEAWPNTGDYFLIETTTLPMAQNEDEWNRVVRFLSKDEWWGYISGEGEYTMGACYVLDCDLGEKLGIRAISN